MTAQVFETNKKVNCLLCHYTKTRVYYINFILRVRFSQAVKRQNTHL